MVSSDLTHAKSFKFQVQLAIIVAVIVVFIMAVISAYYWRKTQRLEYKYQKLVQSSSKDGTTQFAEAPSCGISEDEDEDDDEINGFGNDKKSILGKFKLKVKAIIILELNNFYKNASS